MGLVSGRLAGFLSSEKARKVIVIGGIVVIALLFLSTVIPSAEKDSAAAAQTQSAEDIERGLEQRLSAMISEINGAGSATVMVTLESSAQRVFAEDEKITGSDSGGESSSHGSETEIVLAGSAKEPLEQGVIMPKVRGVAVVCAGASDPTVKEKIANAVAGALGIGISRVYVTC